MSQVRIQIRSHQFATVDQLGEAEDGVFIALPNPPPVRAILRLEQEGKEPQALEVIRVVEIEDAEGGRKPGLVGKYVGLEALEVALGTEHLDSGVAAVGHPGDGTVADPGPQMAVPSPVVDPDPSNSIAVDELERLEGEASVQAASPSPDEGESKKKKRRGRKRR